MLNLVDPESHLIPIGIKDKVMQVQELTGYGPTLYLPSFTIGRLFTATQSTEQRAARANHCDSLTASGNYFRAGRPLLSVCGAMLLAAKHHQ